MIEVKVAGIGIDAVSRNPIVLLRDTTERRALPIWIGEPEAKSIISAIEGRHAPRPLTHDLLVQMIEVCGAQVERVVIHTLKNSTFYASVTLVVGEAKKEIDARPSDAIAIALRANCSIWVVEEVVLEASIPVDQDADEEERRAFREFLSEITPGDLVRRHNQSN
ncbi:MAG: bifunctional nuclease family protein [Pseudanabaenaceae cyanobacterium]